MILFKHKNLRIFLILQANKKYYLSYLNDFFKIKKFIISNNRNFIKIILNKLFDLNYFIF